MMRHLLSEYRKNDEVVNHRLVRLGLAVRRPHFHPVLTRSMIFAFPFLFL